jgi:hypothetical protein
MVEAAGIEPDERGDNLLNLLDFIFESDRVRIELQKFNL